MKLAIALILAATPALSNPLRVIDGDTVKYAGVSYRFPDVDAPEIRSPRCEEERSVGLAAKMLLEDLLRSARVKIIPTGEDCGYDRPCADVFANGRSVIEIGLAEGWLRSWKHENGRAVEARPDWCADTEDRE